MTAPHPLARTLLATGPAPRRAEKLALYGRFAGAWTFDAERTAEDGQKFTGKGAIDFGYVLGGRAVQDVWVLPAPETDAANLGGWAFHGTTLRIYDPGIDAWHIFWCDPLTNAYSRQTGRAVGDDIVQVGTDDGGDAVRWGFSDITPGSFTWTAERSKDKGSTWRREVVFHARRIVA